MTQKQFLIHFHELQMLVQMIEHERLPMTTLSIAYTILIKMFHPDSLLKSVALQNVFMK